MRFNHGQSILALALVSIHSPAFGAPKAGTSLAVLAQNADVALRGRVVFIKRVGELRLADVVVKTPYKGATTGQRFTFVASRLKSHDSSDAKWGEDVLLFLQRDRHDDPTVEDISLLRRARESMVDRPLYRIMHIGSGRVPIVAKEGGEFIGAKRVHWGEGRSALFTADQLELPQGLKPAEDILMTGYLYAVRFADVESAIRRILPR